MANITKFTKPILQDARRGGFVYEAEQAIQKIAAEYGLTFSFNNASFNDLSVTFKAEFKVADARVLATAEQAEFAAYCRLFGLKPEHYEVPLPPHGGVPVRLIGFDLRRRKFPLKGRTADGRTVCYTEAAVFHLKAAA